MRRRGANEKAAMERCREDVERFCSGQCWLRQVMKGHVCSGPLDLHHLIPQRFLRVHVSTLPDEEKWPIVHDPDLCILVCRWGNGGHEQITNAFCRLPWEYLPPRAIEAADRHRVTWKLEQESPLLGSVLFKEQAA